MIDITDKLIPLGDVLRVRFIPRRRAGKKLHPSTVWRWATTGANGALLETVRVGSTLCTTERCLLEFFRACAPAHPNHDQAAPLRRTPARRRRAAAADGA